MMYSIQIIRTHFRKVQKWQPVSSRHFWRFYYNRTLGAKVNDIELNPDTFVAIPPSLSVKQTHKESFEQFYIHFKVEHPFDQVKDLIVIQPHFNLLKWVDEMIDERIKKQDQSKTPTDHSIYMKQLNLITFLLSHVKTSGELYHDNRISEAVKLISKDLSQPISNEFLAKNFSMSVNGFSRLFKESTGISPHQYLLKLRLAKSAELLSDPQISIEDISDQCGFCDRAHFSRLFKKEYNLAPVKYRKEVGL